MRTLLRVGGIAGALAGALALALAPSIGLAVVALVAAAGLAAGLATAKWLPPTWYGRQLGAGLRAGLISCLIAVPVALLALLNFTPQGTPAGIEPAPLAPVVGLGGNGTVVDVLAVALGALAALVLAAASARMFAPDKGTRFVKAVARAREASQPLHDEGIFAPALVRRTIVPLAAVPVAAGVGGRGVAGRLDRPTGAQLAQRDQAPGTRQRRTLTPVTPPEGIAGATAAHRAFDPPARPTGAAPAVRALPPDPELPSEAESPSRVETSAPPSSAAPASAPAPTPAAPALKRRGGGRPAPARLTPEMIEALAAWARDTDEAQEDDEGVEVEAVAAGGAGKRGAAARGPVESTYLNTPAPTPKRKRKKNATRDWIC